MQTHQNNACCGVVELRQYTMQPGQRDTLIAIFERHFIAAQEAAGMTIFGQFRDRARADRFVFLRGFADMASRHTSLEQFYAGDVWCEQQDAANATMIDWHDVLLLRPARLGKMFDVDLTDRPPIGDAGTATPPTVTATVFAGIHGLRAPADDATIDVFERHVLRVLRANGISLDAWLVTEPAPNTFTRLPVREGEHVIVWVGTREAVAEVDGEVDAASSRASAWSAASTATSATSSATATSARDIAATLSRIGDLKALSRDSDPLIVLALEPTSRSLLGHQRTRAVAQHFRR